MSLQNEAFVPDDDNERSTTYQRKSTNGNKLAEPDVTDFQMDTMKKVKQDESFEDDTPNFHSMNFLAVGLASFWKSYDEFIAKHKIGIKRFLVVLLALVIIIYLAAVIRQFIINGSSTIDWCQGYGMAFILYGIMAWILFYYVLFIPYISPLIIRCAHNSAFLKAWRKARVIIAATLAILLAVFLIWDTSSDRRRLISIGGLFVFMLCGFIFSKHPTRVKWNTVFMGLAIQFTMGLFAIRWAPGRQAFKCIGNLAEDFLEYAYNGATFVYGERMVVTDAVFAFQSLSAVYYVSMIVQVLFYLGWMQIFCLKLGWFIQFAMDTTVMESVNAVSSVFLGMTEAPLLYKPYIKDLTPSEMHAVMAGGFSTVSGTVFAAYTALGVDPAHIITASIMTAPAALCFAKLVYPEDMQTRTDSKNIEIYKSEDKSVMDAAVQGALVGVNMILGIIACIIAFVSIVAFFNDLLAWIGLLAGVEDFTLETIFSYIFFPVVWLMGVETSQCFNIARLIGIKVTVNEFVAYTDFAALQKTGVLTARTEAIATYALCSFANPGSVGILLSSLTTLCPSQRHNIIAVSFRAFVSAVTISLLTACIAGALMPEDGFTD